MKGPPYEQVVSVKESHGSGPVSEESHGAGSVSVEGRGQVLRTMKYAEARPQVHTGDVLACTGMEWLSRQIQYWTHSDISHLAFAVWLRIGKQSADRLCIFEATTPGGVRLTPFSQILREHAAKGEAVRWLALKADAKIDGDEAVGHALAAWGQRFVDFVDLAAVAWPWVAAFLHRQSPLLRGRWECTSLVTYGLMKAGLCWPKLPELTWPGEVTRFGCFHDPVLLGS